MRQVIRKKNAIIEFCKENPLAFIFISPWIIDICVTLLGQDSSYWQTLQTVNEAHPIYHYLLTIHPLAFIMGNIVEMYVLYIAVKWLKRPFNLMLALGYGIGTAWSSASWTYQILSTYGNGQQTNWFYWDTIYFCILGIIYGWCIHQYITICIAKKH